MEDQEGSNLLGSCKEARRDCLPPNEAKEELFFSSPSGHQDQQFLFLQDPLQDQQLSSSFHAKEALLLLFLKPSWSRLDRTPLHLQWRPNEELLLLSMGWHEEAFLSSKWDAKRAPKPLQDFGQRENGAALRCGWEGDERRHGEGGIYRHMEG